MLLVDAVTSLAGSQVWNQRRDWVHASVLWRSFTRTSARRPLLAYRSGQPRALADRVRLAPRSAGRSSVAPGISEQEILRDLRIVGDSWLVKDVQSVVHRERARQSETERVAPVHRRLIELLEVAEQIEIGVEQQPSHPDVADDRRLDAGLVEVFLFGVDEQARLTGLPARTRRCIGSGGSRSPRASRARPRDCERAGSWRRTPREAGPARTPR